MVLMLLSVIILLQASNKMSSPTSNECTASLIESDEVGVYSATAYTVEDVSEETFLFMGEQIRDGMSKVVEKMKDHILVFTLLPNKTVQEYYNNILRLLHENPHTKYYETDSEFVRIGTTDRTLKCTTKSGPVLIIKMIGLCVDNMSTASHIELNDGRPLSEI